MKKILFVLSFLCSALMINAQVLSVQGIVSDSTGNPVSNVQIVISNPALGASVPIGWATTNSNGSYFWMDTIGILPIFSAGILDVGMIDCDGTQINQSVSYSPNLLALTSNFTFCGNGSGGGGSGNGSCALSFTPASINGNTVGMTATLSGANATGAISYFWDMGDGNSYSTSTVNHTYATAGTYTLCAVGVSASGCADTSCVTIVTNGTGGGNCSTSFFYYPDSFNMMTHHFLSQAIGGTGAYSYVWDFGDGNTSTVANPTHTYTQNGFYTVCVTVTDANGCTAVDCQPVSVGGFANCTASMTYTPDSMNPMIGYFNVVTTGGTAPYTYVWDFGDGIIFNSTSSFSTHTYLQSGFYNACVTITDATGCVATDCQPVIAFNSQNCHAILSSTPDSMNPLVNYFNVQSTGGVAPYTYAWDFGDGNTTTTQSPTHTYAQSGSYYVCVTVTDATGCVATDCSQIYTGGGTPCTTSFTSSTTAANPNAYMFTSANANSNNTLYLWDFGDGHTDTISNGIATHVYTQAGTYVVCLAELDFLTGCTAIYCDTIVVAGGAACQSFITWNNVTGSLVVDFFGSSSTNATTYVWDFGDGNTSTAQNPTHTYSTVATGPVTYNVTLTTTDANGCTSTVTETVFIFATNGLGQIMGYLWKDTINFTPADGLVYLIEYDSIAGTLTAIDTVQTQQGFFDFQNIPMGSYLVKAALLPSDVDYANYLPTYYVQSLAWGNGQYIGPTPFGLPAFIDIQLIAGNNPGGPGFIGGLVVNGAGRPVNGNLTLVEDILDSEPMEGVSVLLLDANNNAVTHTTTAPDGSYSFSNIPMGTYNVHVEEVGKVTFDATVLVDGSNLNHTDVHFTVHENMVTLTGTYAVTNVEDFQVFPNPVSDVANVQLKLNESMELTLTVTNLMGQTFINQNMTLNAGDNTFPVDMNDLPAGLYMVSLKSGSDVITYRVQKM